MENVRLFKLLPGLEKIIHKKRLYIRKEFSTMEIKMRQLVQNLTVNANLTAGYLIVRAQATRECSPQLDVYQLEQLVL